MRVIMQRCVSSWGRDVGAGAALSSIEFKSMLSFSAVDAARSSLLCEQDWSQIYSPPVSFFLVGLFVYFFSVLRLRRALTARFVLGLSTVFGNVTWFHRARYL